MSSDPGVGQDVDALVSSAVIRLSRGELDAAEVYCRQALAQQKGHMGALTVLGSVMHSLARFREAESLFTELTERAPDTADLLEQSRHHASRNRKIRRSAGGICAGRRAWREIR